MDFLHKLSSGQKISLSLLLLVILALFSVGGVWLFSPKQEALYQQMDTRMAAQAAQRLDEAGVSYEIVEENGSNTINVQQGQADRLRVTLSGQLGLPEVTGLEIFDHADYSMTDFSQQIAYQRAIQGELARTLSEMNGIRSARIHLSLAPQKLFRADKQLAKAAVYLELDENISPAEINPLAIKQIVSHAIADLPASNVTVFDQQGNELSTDEMGNINTRLNKRLEFINQREAKLTARVYNLLGLLFKPQDIAISVNIAMNFDQKTQRVEEILTNENGEGAVIRSRQQQVNEALEVAQEGVLNTPINTESEREYRHGNELVETVFSPGVIEQISVGIVVNAQLSESEKQQITQLVAAGMGINPERGDQLVFEAISLAASNGTSEQPRSENTVNPVQSQSDTLSGLSHSEQNMDHSGSLPLWAMLLVTLLVLAILLLIVFMSSGKQVRKNALQDIHNWIETNNA